MNSNAIMLLIVYGIFFVIIISMMSKQRKNKQKKLEEIKSLKVNDKIITIGGLYGKIVEVNDTTFVITTDDRTQITIEKGAVSRKVVEPAKEI